MNFCQLFIALLLLTVLPVKSSACTNPLLTPIKDVLTIFNEPRNPSPQNVCNSMWQTTKTCCGYDSLKEWVDRDKSELIDSSKKLKKVLENVNERISWLQVKVAKLIAKHKLLFLTEFGSIEYGVRLLNSYERCRNYTIETRASAVCFLCAGNFQEFQTKSRAAVNMDACSNMHKSCREYFIKMATFLESVGRMVEIKDKSMDELNAPDLKWYTDLKDQLSQSAFLPLIKRVNDENKLTDLQKDALIIKLCTMVYKVVKRPFLMQLNSIFVRLLPQVVNLVKHLGDDSAEQEGPRLLKVKATSESRLLHGQSEDKKIEAEDVAGMFTSDTIVLLKPTDSMWTSFEGVDGSSLAIENSHLKPMNMSTKFP